MIISALFAFLHFIAVFGIVATLSGEWLLLSRNPTLAQARLIQLSDRWYGIFAALLLAVGFARVHLFEKGFDFYRANPFYHLKLALFLVVGLLSIYPTVRFIRWRAQTRNGLAPVVTERQFQWLRAVLLVELTGLAGIALCATLMARGIGS